MKSRLIVVITYMTIRFINLKVSALQTSRDSEWPVMYSGLPDYSKEGPTSFTLNLTWRSGTNSASKTISLNLERSEAVDPQLSIYMTGDDGKPVQVTLYEKESWQFYQEAGAQASVSLMSYNRETFTMKGSFLLGNQMYEVEPNNPEIHKRSTSVLEGDYIVKRRKEEKFDSHTDYLTPSGDNANKINVLKRKVEKKRILKSREKRLSKRQAPPATTYTVQICMVIDYYFYRKLTKSRQRTDSLGENISYVALAAGHLANEVDIMYRSINSTAVDKSFDWTIGTKLSYLIVATTGKSSPWTYPSPNGTAEIINTYNSMLEWITQYTVTHSLTADHYTLATGLDLVYNGNREPEGLSILGDVCNSFSISIVEPKSSILIAHEIGHSLGSYHDGSSNTCDSNDQYIMRISASSTRDENIGNPWKFSACSIKSFGNLIKKLNNESRNCLTDSGSHFEEWQSVSEYKIGQVISVHEQCRLLNGGDYYYRSINPRQPIYEKICQELHCTKTGRTVSIHPPAWEYTSCETHKWCIKGECVADPRAPAISESCPLGDDPGPNIGNSGLRCTNVTQVDCSTKSQVARQCCSTCSKHATPWLGPTCMYGDKWTGCPISNATSSTCINNHRLCCNSCCKVNGPPEGYHCNPENVTTVFRTTSTNSQTMSSVTDNTVRSVTTSAPKPSTSTTSAKNSMTRVRSVTTSAPRRSTSTTSAKNSMTRVRSVTTSAPRRSTSTTSAKNSITRVRSVTTSAPKRSTSTTSAKNGTTRVRSVTTSAPKPSTSTTSAKNSITRVRSVTTSAPRRSTSRTSAKNGTTRVVQSILTFLVSIFCISVSLYVV